jgi:hypothetical protein
MVHFMQKLKCTDDFPREEELGKKRERARE